MKENAKGFAHMDKEVSFMKGIGNYEAYRTNTKAFQPYGKKTANKYKKAGNAEKTEGSAAEYEMSDNAKEMAPDRFREYQKLSVSGSNSVKKQEIGEGIELSEAAKDLLKELKEKHGDIDFFVAEFSTDEEAQAYHRQSTKKYSCVIDPKTLEEMAADEKVKEKYVSIIDSADEQFDKIKEELGEDAREVTRFGINVDKDGVVSYFAELTKETARMQKGAMEDAKARRAETKAQSEKLEKAREKKKAEEAEKAEKAEEVKQEKAENEAPSNRFTASSIEELLTQLKDALAARSGNKTETTTQAVGQNFDMSM